MTTSRPNGPLPRRRWAALALAVLATTGGSVALTSCSDDGGNDTESATSVSARPSAPDTSSFSGEPPSALASKEASKRASASARAESASAAASSFEASVSAETERRNRAAAAELEEVDGRGNALDDVTVTGKPRVETGDVRVAVVTIVNRSPGIASYAVQVDFRDADGKVVESRTVGAEDLEPGDRAQPVAVSRKPGDQSVFAVVAKAQRY
ncbi:hypothetical protein [Streptomyces sp. NPDC060194]|uniref:hypothetical protein n=1 Tax=Streptomyces sp. NPDC060194 TaxID=3347069 RepID=UPI003660445C